jgi:hypothetical protein
LMFAALPALMFAARPAALFRIIYYFVRIWKCFFIFRTFEIWFEESKNMWDGKWKWIYDYSY